MKWSHFIEKVINLPIIDTEILLSGISDQRALKVQISRWEKAGKLIQLKRGIYVLAPVYRKVPLYEPFIASFLKQPSYMSLQKALEFYSLIPEGVYVYTSVTTKRPGTFTSEIGTFEYRHIKTALFWGYTAHTLNNQTAFIATPEKAVLDYFYLNGSAISHEYLAEMRLQNVDALNEKTVLTFAQRFNSPSMVRVAKIINTYCAAYHKDEKIV